MEVRACEERDRGELERLVRSLFPDEGHREIGSDAVLRNEVSIAAHKSLGFREHDRVVRFAKKL
ncbi:MAG TPA: hypothetical protein VFQ53_29210 [Kofleriaceae bacterium]|nr:hypothetical protein [Kofleriaceae bacterium]